MVKIGSARIDENGHATGGKAGDQTGKEVSTQNWYMHQKGWRVFRAKDSKKATMIAQDMQWACDNSNIGYDQSQRLTLYAQAEKVGFNCSEIKTKCETDCSALVRVCCAYAGIMLPNFVTTNEPNVLMASGYFIELTEFEYTDNYNYLKRGDILVTRKQGHTVVVLTDGAYADLPIPKPDYRHVIVTGGSVYVRTAPNTQNGKILGVVHKNNILQYQYETSSGGWYLVIYKNQNAWISPKYSKLIR